MISQLSFRPKSINIVARSSLQLGLLLLLAFVLSACSNNPSISDTVQVRAEEVQSEEAEAIPPSPEDWTRHDAQGAVEVSATPLNIYSEITETFDFEISMNTHSVDLSMDLTTSSTLETNLGELLHPVSWSGGNGHHVQGILVFPTQTSTGNDFLEGASNLTLIIRDVGAPVREFVWEVTGLE